MADIWSWAEGAVITATIVTVTILIGITLAKILGRVTQRLLAEAEVNRLLKQSGVKAIDQRVGSLVEWAIYSITGLTVLQELGLTRIAIGIVIIGGSTLIGLSILLALRSFVPNYVHGFKVRKELKNKIGKEVKIGMVEGKLLKIGRIQSIIMEKEKHYLPHSYTAKQLQAN